MRPFHLTLAFLLTALALHAEEALRDPWLRPFATTSIWNMPIGSEASYVPAGFQATGGFAVDDEVLLRVAADAPERPLFAPLSWQTRAGGKQHLPPVRINDQDVVPDARKYWTPNFCAALLMPDGRTVRHLGPLCRPEPGGPVFAYTFGESDLHGDGIVGSHGGSRMSALGGSVRLGELTSDEPIRHALKVDVLCAKYCFFDESLKGFRWPAAYADSYAKGNYKGSNKAVVIGSLLALRPEVKISELPLKTAVAKKLFHAFQDYGAYIVDDSAHEVFYLCAELGVSDEVKAKFGHPLSSEWKDYEADMRQLLPLLHVVDNNAADRIGGGGTPRQPLATPLADKPAGEAPKNIPPLPLLKIALKNPELTDGNERPDAWTNDWGLDGKAKVTRDTETYHSAPSSLCITSLGGNVQGQVAQVFDATGGQRLRVSSWLRADGGANAMLAVQSFSAEWKSLSMNIIGNSLTGMNWKQVRGEVTLPPGTARVGIQLMLNGPGKAWLDDVSADGKEVGANALPKSVSLPKPQGPPKAKHSCDPAEGFYPEYPTGWKQTFEGQVNRTKQGNVPLIFLGDSLTQGWKEQPHWKEHYAKLGAVNYGIGGDGTAQVLWRIDHGLLDGLKPKVIVLCIGVNNIWPGFDAEDTIKGIIAVVTRLQEKCPHSKVLLLGNTHLFDDKKLRQRVRTINAAQAKLADGQRVRFLDFSEKMLSPDDALKPELFTKDKLHLSPEGYALWAREMDGVLEQLLR